MLSRAVIIVRGWPPKNGGISDTSIQPLRARSLLHTSRRAQLAVQQRLVRIQEAINV